MDDNTIDHTVVDTSGWITTKEAGKILKVHEETIRRRFHRGKLRGKQFITAKGEQILIDPTSMPTPTQRPLSTTPVDTTSTTVVATPPAAALALMEHLANLDAERKDLHAEVARLSVENGRLTALLDVKRERPWWRVW